MKEAVNLPMTINYGESLISVVHDMQYTPTSSFRNIFVQAQSSRAYTYYTKDEHLKLQTCVL